MKMNTLRSIAFGLIVALGSQGASAANEQAAFFQDVFAIGFWVDPPADEHMDQHSFAYTAWPTLEFDVSLDQIREVCKVTGREIPMVDDSPAMEGFQVSLNSGEGRLFLLSGN